MKAAALGANAPIRPSNRGLQRKLPSQRDSAAGIFAGANTVSLLVIQAMEYRLDGNRDMYVSLGVPLAISKMRMRCSRKLAMAH